MFIPGPSTTPSLLALASPAMALASSAISSVSQLQAAALAVGKAVA